MQARRVLSLSAIALTTLCTFSMLGACGDDKTVYVYLEASCAVDASKKDATVIDDDGGDQPTTCDPQPVASFTFKSPGKYLGKCTDDQLGKLYDACLSEQNTIADCDAAKTQFADCSSCAFGTATDSPAHPWIIYDENVVAFPNVGLCMATIRDESAPTECGVANAQLFTCLNQACLTPCIQLGTEAFNTCRGAALDNNVCKAGAQTAFSTKCSAAYKATDPTYGFCTSEKDEQGKPLDDRAFDIAVARLTCGNNPNPSDAGSDADAGDAGDMDAEAGL